MRWVLISLVAVFGLAVLAALATWLYLRAPDIPYETLAARYADASSRYLDVPGGVRVHYRDEGRSDGPILVLIHGGGDNLWTWDGWVQRLGAHYRILRFDLPGHGLTRAPADYRFAKSDDVVAQTLDALHLHRFVLGGSSLGGLAAWRYAAAHPDRVQALILLDSAGLPDEAKTSKAPLAFRILRYSWGRAILESIDNKPLIVDSLKRELGHREAMTKTLVDRWADLQRAPGHRHILMAGLANGIAPPSKAAVLATLATIKAPTLILWGAVDPLTPAASGRSFQAAIAGSKLIVYPGTGHLPQIEIPTQSAADADAFLSGLFVRNAAER